MAFFYAAPVEDHAEVRSRVRSIEVGSRLKLAAFGAAFAYALVTWGSPHRTVLTVLLVAASAWALAPLVMGAERIVRSRRREALFLAWSLGTVALVAAMVAFDGGARSPFALLVFLPLAFAALSYPLPSVVAVGTAAVVAFTGVGLAVGQASQPYLGLFVSCLVITALLCAWEALDHSRERRGLAQVSRADPLTGCLNRRGFEERLEAEIDSSTRSGASFALVTFDLDHFKAVNDTRGHAAGDELLCWAVERADHVLRPMDSLGRLGGDEFAIVVPGADVANAREVAGRLRDVLAERVSVSTGIAAFPVDGPDRESLHRRADADLYTSKRGGARGSRDLTFASALASAVNLRMTVADESSSSVGYYAEAIGRQLELSDRELSMLRLAAILHDVGKVSVPEGILRKAGPLTIDEFEQVKTHPCAGAEIVAHVDGLTPVAEWIRHSHEHVDGSGYPSGLRGGDIPLGSRVLLVADAFDAMTNVRPYGSPLPPDMALAELRMGAGTQFDGRCVDALEAHLDEHPLELRARRFLRADPIRAA